MVPNRVTHHIVEKCGIKPNVLVDSKQSTNDYEILKDFIQLYDNHPSIIQIRNHITT